MGRLLDMAQSGMDRLYGAHVEDRRPGPADDFWYGAAGSIATTGIRVTVDRAMQVPVFFDCVQILTEPIATLPLKIFRRLPDGSKQAIDDHPLNRVLRRPNDEQTGFEFRGQMQEWAVTHKNAYAEIIPNPRGFGPIAGLRPHHPDMVQVQRKADGQIVYRVTSDRNEPTRVFNRDEMWHLKYFPIARNGLTGRPIIETSRDAIGRSIAVQEYGARFFRNDATPGGVLEYPGHFKDKESKANYLSAWYRAQAGKNRGRIALLEHDIKYHGTAIDNRHAQFVEASREANLDICRLWGIPPHRAGILDRATFSNIEQQALEFIIYTLLPWLKLWEEAITLRLIDGADDLFAEFNVAGLLRGDLKTRYEAYAIGRLNGWLSVNDILKLENMNPIGPEGDTRMQPMNMAPLGTPAAASAMNGSAALAIPKFLSNGEVAP